jgi:transcriptional regulator with XRE-family HTH domain
MDKIKMGKFLTQLRNDKNLRQQDEAEIFQVSPQAISKWESGDSVPDIGTLEKLSNFYKVGIDEIINGEVKNPNANVSTVVVAKNPTMEERGIGKPYYGAFIFSMSAIFLALIFSILPYLGIPQNLGGTYLIVLENMYQMLFATTGPYTVFTWFATLTFFASALMSIGLWLSPKNRHAFWLWGFWLSLVNVVLNVTLFILLLGSTINNYGGAFLETGSIVLTVFSILYFVLYLTLPLTRKRTFCPRTTTDTTIVNH